jgi:hypothetical protein
MFYLNDYEIIQYTYIYTSIYNHIYMNTCIYIYIFLHAYHICDYLQLYFFQDRQLKSYVYIYIDWLIAFFSRAPVIDFSQRIVTKFTFHFIYTLSPTSSTSRTSSTSLIEPIGPIGIQRLQISCNTPTILFTQELWHSNS